MLVEDTSPTNKQDEWCNGAHRPLKPEGAFDSHLQYLLRFFLIILLSGVNARSRYLFHRRKVGGIRRGVKHPGSSKAGHPPDWREMGASKPLPGPFGAVMGLLPVGEIPTS